MRLAELVATSDAVRATRSRKDKVALLAELLAQADPAEVGLIVSFLAGEPRQGRVGVGWTTISGVEVRASTTPSLTVTDLDTLFAGLAATGGDGSAATRAETLTAALRQATAAEADFLRRLLLGELRQGANEGIVVEAVAAASNTPAAAVRRALMLSGDLAGTAATARTLGRQGLDAVTLDVLRPLRPMLAATTVDVAEAIDALGRCSVEWKLDGARVQVHRHGDEVRIWTRNLNEVTDRLPTVVDRVRAMPADRLVLDGEVVGLADDGPAAFRDTMRSFGSAAPAGPHLQPRFFDVLHHDGTDLVDAPLIERRAILERVAGPVMVPGRITDRAAEAQAVLDEALAAGHEGVMVKDAEAPYAAGRRGKTWRKVKPVHTFDLVVLAAEWGHGRRQGWLSNLHLGARSGEGHVMVGKTFKGLTDELLRWQTADLLARRTAERGITVEVRPELVIEIAVDGVQASTRYPGGVALRFARVRRYRPDKSPAEADAIEAVRAMLRPAQQTPGSRRV